MYPVDDFCKLRTPVVYHLLGPCEQHVSGQGVGPGMRRFTMGLLGDMRVIRRIDGSIAPAVMEGSANVCTD